MTHDPDANVFMPPAPQSVDTDVFSFLIGEGFVTWNPNKVLPSWQHPSVVADPMPSVADEVRVLEGLLR